MDGVALKKELKQWEHDFIKKYNRSPKRNDIDKLPTIKSKYKIYSKFKSQKTKLNRTPIKADLTNEDTISNESIDALVNEEFGPTPQIYGKSISLFEINLSPVKKRLDLSGIDDILNDTDEDDGDGDDTINISQEDVGTENLVQDTENINDSLSIRHESKPIYGPNSPLKIESSLKLHQTTPRRNLNLELTTNATPFGISPSPLFKRSFTKSLKELENEFQTVRKELKLDEINEEEDSDNGEKKEDNVNTNDDPAEEQEQEQEQEEHVPEIKKATTLKKKRRNIIKRVHDSNDDQATVHKNVDLHAMLRNIKRTKLKEFIDKESISLSSVLNNKLELEDVKLNKDEKDETVKKHVKRKHKKKYNLVSNNFRRLKLPTKSKRNTRWSRRR